LKASIKASIHPSVYPSGQIFLKSASKETQAHRRDALIEFIKGLLAVPFVLHSQPTASNNALVSEMAAESHRRYREIMKDIEQLINDHSMSLLPLTKQPPP
jgi:hypothetical protein